MRERDPAVYILASRRNGTLYTGVTSDLVGRMSEHRQNLTPGFASRHGVHHLVYYEDHGTMPDAIGREKQIKKMSRAEKIALIEAANPLWRDMWGEISGEDDEEQ